MRILVIGGGVFLGAAIVDSALARGHAITVFNRGRARSDWPAGVEAIVGDRSSDLGLLRGRGFDAVVDVCGFVPADLRASAAAHQAVGFTGAASSAAGAVSDAPRKRFCSACGSEAQPGAKFCANCAAPLRQPA